MSTVATLMVKLQSDIRGFQKGMDTASSKVKQVGKSMSRAGATLTKSVTLPIIAMGTAAVATVSRFDDAMSEVSAISGATGTDLARMRDLAKEMGSTTRFAASESAEAMKYLALAGWDTNQILEATPGLLSLAAASGMELGRAADIVSDTMSGFAMSADEAGTAADVFAAASSQSNTNVEQLGQAMVYSAANARAAGMDIQQTASVLGVLADSGIKGSMAGTTFNAMLRDMRNAAVEGQIAVGEMTIELYRADGSMRDMGKVMADMEKATEGMTTAQRDAAMGAIFTERSIKGANIMIATGSDRYRELEGAMYDAQGTANSMAETMEDNIGGAFRELKSQTEGILISLGEQLVPVIRNTVIPAVQEFGNRLTELIKWFQDLDPKWQRIIGLAIAFAAALGPVLFITGKVISIFGILVGAIGGVSTALAFLAANPVAIVIMAIGGLIAVGIAVWRNWEEIKIKLLVIWELIQASAVAVSIRIQQAWYDVQRRVYGVVEAIIDAVAPLVEWLPGWVTAGFDRLREGVSQNLGDVENKMSDLAVQSEDNFGRVQNALGATGAIFSKETDNMQAAMDASMGQEQMWMEQQQKLAAVTADTTGSMAAGYDDVAAAATGAGAGVNQLSADVGALAEQAAELNEALGGGVMSTESGRASVLSFAEEAAARGQDVQAYAGDILAESERRLRGHAARVSGYDESRVASDLQRVASAIPVLHSGTSFFEPPGGGREGLALLQRGEQVIPRGGGRSVTVNISGNQISSDYDVDRIGDQLVKKLRLEGVV